MAGNAFDTLKKSVLVRVVAGLAVLAVAGWFVATRFMPGTTPGAAPTAARHAPAQAAAPAVRPAATVGPQIATVKPAAASPAAKVATVKPAAATASGPVTVSARPVSAGAPVARTASAGTSARKVPARAAAGDGSASPVVTAVTTQAAPATPAHFDEHQTYQYNALGRRDPFQSLVEGQFVGADVGGDAPPDPGGIKVVGIVWGANDQFALVEDVRGNSFVLRKGDKVQNGFVEGLKRDGLIVNITAEGQSQSVVIPLTRKGDQNAR